MEVLKNVRWFQGNPTLVFSQPYTYYKILYPLLGTRMAYLHVIDSWITSDGMWEVKLTLLRSILLWIHIYIFLVFMFFIFKNLNLLHSCYLMHVILFGQITLCFLLSTWHLHFFIVDHRYDPMQRVVWVLISVGNHYFRIINVFSPNDVVERSQLWC